MKLRNTEVTLQEYRGPSNELMKKLSGKNGKWWLGALNRLLRMENPYDVTKFDTWATIDYGSHTNQKFLKTECSKTEMTDEAWSILNSLKTSKEYQKADLVVASVKMLGFKHVKISEINQRVQDLGFKLPTPEQVFNLHYQFIDNSRDDLTPLFPAMEPVSASDGRRGFLRFGLKLKHRSLEFFYDEEVSLYFGDRVVFVKP